MADPEKKKPLKPPLRPLISVATGVPELDFRVPVSEPPPAIRPAQIGDSYDPPSWDQIMTMDNPLRGLAEWILGRARPSSVAAADPYGIEAARIGAGPWPIFMGTTQKVGTALPGSTPLYSAVRGAELRPAALRALGPARWRRGLEGRYAAAELSGPDAEHVLAAIENVAERFPSLKRFLPDMAKALEAHPPSAGTLADGVFREPGSGLILPTPPMMARWARYGLYGEEIPANWGPLTQPGVREAFGPDPREIRLYADLWGAISPLNDPMVNTVQANRAFGRTLGPEGFAPMGEGEFSRLGLGLPSRRPNINRAMEGVPLEGPKVPRMSGMLQGTERLPPIDEHVTTATGGASGKWSEELARLRRRVQELTGDEFKGKAGELRLNAQLSEGLIEMWRAMYPERPPLTSMAASWEGIRSDKGIKSVGGPYDILRRLGLGEPGAMLDRARVLASKWPGGYISSGVLLPLLLSEWGAVTDAQPENAPASDAPPR